MKTIKRMLTWLRLCFSSTARREHAAARYRRMGMTYYPGEGWAFPDDMTPEQVDKAIKENYG